MIRNLKMLGLAVAAVSAMSAVVGSAAQAQVLTAGAYPATLTGEQSTSHKFAVGARVYTCATVKSHATLSAASSELTATPTYEGCDTEPVLGVSLKVTFTMNGCTYTYTLYKESAEYKAHMDIVCPAGQVIEVHLYSDAAHTKKVCTITIGPQTNKTTITLTNMAAIPPATLDDVTYHHNVTLVAQPHGSPLICGAETANQNIVFTGTTTLKADGPSGIPTSLTVSG